jgi:hypothetical protein
MLVANMNENTLEWVKEVNANMSQLGLIGIEGTSSTSYSFGQQCVGNIFRIPAVLPHTHMVHGKHWYGCGSEV